MSPAQQLAHAILPSGQPAAVEEIRIAIVSAQQFRWSLWRGGEEIFAGFGDAGEVAGMTSATELLVNTELGVAPLSGLSREAVVV